MQEIGGKESWREGDEGRDEGQRVGGMKRGIEGESAGRRGRGEGREGGRQRRGEEREGEPEHEGTGWRVWKQGGPLCFLLGLEGPWLPGRACDGFTREEMEA